MLTDKQRHRVALYHWFASYIDAIAECREVWRVDTRCPSKLFTYRSA